ncbi:MAG: hypothetical protein NTY62_07760 [Euryarchaeota archaeon]|nr:hypothetical protein [Euryarchaeota archaeon]
MVLVILAAAIVVTALGYGYTWQSSEMKIDFYDDGEISTFGMSYVVYDNGRKVVTGYTAMSSASGHGHMTWPVKPGTHEVTFDYVFSSDGEIHTSELDGQTDWSGSVYVLPYMTGRLVVSYHDMFLQQSE